MNQHQITVAFIAWAYLHAGAAAFAQSLPRFVSSFGSEGTGPGQFCGHVGIAIDPMGRVVAADEGNNRIQVFDVDGTLLMAWGQGGSTDGQFEAPTAVAVDASGFAYVADSANDRIQKFSANGHFVKKWGSYCGVPGDGECSGRFSRMSDIAVDASAKVYVVEFGNHRVQKFDSEGNFLLKWGTRGNGPGQFESPLSIAIDAHGDVYVGEFSRVQKFDSDGNFILQWAEPAFCLGTRSGVVYVCANSGCRLFTSEGVFLTDWRDDDVPVPQKDERPVYAESIAFDARNNAYLANANRVLKFTFEPEPIEPTSWSFVKQMYRR